MRGNGLYRFVDVFPPNATVKLKGNGVGETPSTVLRKSVVFALVPFPDLRAEAARTDEAPVYGVRETLAVNNRNLNIRCEKKARALFILV